MTSPLAGLPTITNMGAQADVKTLIDSINSRVDSRLVNRFANAGERDARFQAWVAAGGTMVDGLMCTVAGMPQVRSGGTWRGLGPAILIHGTGPTAFDYPDPQGAPYPGVVIGRVNIPDYGVPYRIQTDCAAEVYPTDISGAPVESSVTRVDSLMSCNGTDWDLWRGDVGNHHKHYGISPVTFTGAQILNMQAFRAVPEPGVGYFKKSNLNFWMRALVLPA